MLEAIIYFILKYKFIFLFYLIVIVLLIWKRKKIDVQAKFIFLYRMKFGLKWMDKCAKKFREWIIILGYIGVGAGYIGMIVITFVLVKNLYDLITKPAAINGVSLVLPGVNIPGLGILPFWYWLIAIFLIALIHEFSHGIVARAHKIEVRNTGIVLFGPILGAFVEPNEKNLRKQSDITQYSVLAAGSFSNIILALVALALLSFVFMPIQGTMIEPVGFTFDAYVSESLPAAQAGILPGTLITGINNQEVKNFQEFDAELTYHKPGEMITINTKDKEYSLVLATNPDNEKKGYLGVNQIRNDYSIKEPFRNGIGKAAYFFLEWFNGTANGGKGFLFWLYLLSFGIGLFNLLPLPIVDGGRMAQVFLHKLKGKEKGEKRYRQISLLLLLVLLLNLIYPFLAKLI